MQVSPPKLGGEAAAVSKWNHFLYCRSGVVPKTETFREDVHTTTSFCMPVVPNLTRPSCGADVVRATFAAGAR
jgi:hypothetical protein